MGCLCGKNGHSEDDYSVLDMEGTNIEIFSGHDSFKLYAVKNKEIVNKINIPKLWIEGKHCTIHTTNDVEIRVEGTTLNFSGEATPIEDDVAENVSGEISDSDIQQMDVVDSAISPSNKKNLLPILKAIDTQQKQDLIKGINLVHVVPDLMKKCRISHYASQSEFYVTLNDNIPCQQFIQDEGKASVSGPFRQSLECQVRLQCLIAGGDFEGSRGVISHMEDNKITVKLLDIGREVVVTEDQLAGIPEKIDFSHIEAQAIRCCLYRCRNNVQESADMLKYIVATETPTKVHFVGCKSDTWHVSLIRTSNVLVKEYEPIFMALGYAAQPPIQSSKAYIGYVDESNRQLWLQREDEAAVYDQLLEKCSGNNMEPLHAFNIGDPCLCKSLEDDSWYRGVICSYDSANEVTVQYIDYGNKELLPCKNVKCLLKDDIMKHHPLSYPCILKDGHQISDFSKLLQLLNTTLDITVHQKIGAFFEISVTIGEMNIIEKLSPEKGLLVPENNPNLGEDTNFTILHTEDDGRLWVQNTTNAAAAEELDSVMEAIADTEHIPVEAPSVGQYVCCQFSEDQVWYRAVILSLPDDLSVRVRYVDFGNAETTTVDRLKVLEIESTILPWQAVECRLYDPVAEELVQADAFSQLEVLCMDGDYTGQFLRPDAPHGLVLSAAKTSDGRDVCDAVRQSSLYETVPVAVASDVDDQTVLAAQTSTPPAFCVRNDDHTAIALIITELSDPMDGTFWLQTTETEAEFAEMSGALADHMESEGGACKLAVDDITPGTACIAMYSLDEVWYRSVVMTNHGDTCSVRFIDYGNCGSALTSELYALPARLATLPRQAVQCSLRVLRHVAQPLTQVTLDTIGMLETDVNVSGKLEQIDGRTYVYQLVVGDAVFDDKFASLTQDGATAVAPLTNGVVAMPPKEFEVGTWKNEEYRAINQQNGVCDQLDEPTMTQKDDAAEASDSENNKDAVFLSVDNSESSSQDNQWADANEKSDVTVVSGACEPAAQSPVDWQ